MAALSLALPSAVPYNGICQLTEVGTLMTGFSARRVATALAVCSVSVLAFILPSAASATSIHGAGSTLQEIAQQHIFIPAFEKTHAGDTITYTGTSSGKGLEAWGNKHACEHTLDQYIGTDQPPNPSQKKAIEEKCPETPGDDPTVLSIPTLQAAVAIIYHLPANCTSASSKAKKETTHLAFTDKTVEEIFAGGAKEAQNTGETGKKTHWNELTDEGDALHGTGCETTKEIVRVVREEGSGTTAILKKWLNQVEPNYTFDVPSFVPPENEDQSWNELAENSKNLHWPHETASNIVRGTGSPGVIAKVEATPGSIGYVNLANAYEEGSIKLGGDLGWAVIENKGGKKPTYTNPELPGAKIAKSKPKKYKEGTSNCVGEIYVNGVGAKFPPEKAEDAWNEVTATPSEPNYPICGFTYDLSLKCFSQLTSAEQPSVPELALIQEYFKFMIKEGPTLLKAGTDYLALPTNPEPKKNVAKIAEEGANEIC
jgi:ABC-type phosphate transport system substrate-binding protein